MSKVDNLAAARASWRQSSVSKACEPGNRLVRGATVGPVLSSGYHNMGRFNEGSIQLGSSGVLVRNRLVANVWVEFFAASCAQIMHISEIG